MSTVLNQRPGGRPASDVIGPSPCMRIVRPWDRASHSSGAGVGSDSACWKSRLIGCTCGLAAAIMFYELGFLSDLNASVAFTDALIASVTSMSCRYASTISSGFTLSD